MQNHDEDSEPTPEAEVMIKRIGIMSDQEAIIQRLSLTLTRKERLMMLPLKIETFLLLKCDGKSGRRYGLTVCVVFGGVARAVP